ncbi:MAG: ribose 5-phosphate isomerase B [Bacteroidota bacterium]
MNKIAIGCDHAGFDLKEKIKLYLSDKSYMIIDKGCYTNERVDYPDFAHVVSREVLLKNVDFGILLCGSGNGIAMSANKHKGIRAAICWNPEISQLARQHNDANILVLPARFLSEQDAFKIIDGFISEKFEGGRHLDRIHKIDLV